MGAEHALLPWPPKLLPLVHYATLAPNFTVWRFWYVIPAEAEIGWMGWTKFRISWGDNLGYWGNFVGLWLLVRSWALPDVLNYLVDKLVGNWHLRVILLVLQVSRDLPELLCLLTGHDPRSVTICVRDWLIVHFANVNCWWQEVFFRLRIFRIFVVTAVLGHVLFENGFLSRCQCVGIDELSKKTALTLILVLNPWQEGQCDRITGRGLHCFVGSDFLLAI